MGNGRQTARGREVREILSGGGGRGTGKTKDGKKKGGRETGRQRERQTDRKTERRVMRGDRVRYFCYYCTDCYSTMENRHHVKIRFSAVSSSK